MKNTWIVWLIIVGVVITILIAFNYRSTKETVSINELFPEEAAKPVDVEYEFVETAGNETDVKMKQTNIPPSATAGSAIVTPPKAAPVVPAPAKPSTPPSLAVVAQAPVPSSTFASSMPKAPFTIQALSLKDRVAAEKALTQAKAKGYSAQIVARQVKDQGTWYRVYIGEFQTKKEAETMLEMVKKDYKDSFVISPVRQ